MSNDDELRRVNYTTPGADRIENRAIPRVQMTPSAQLPQPPPQQQQQPPQPAASNGNNNTGDNTKK